MREFIVSSIAVVLISVVVEIFCPIKAMKKPFVMVMSMVVLLIIVGGVKNIIKNENSFLDISNLSLDLSSSQILEDIIQITENQIKINLKNNDVDVKDIVLYYEIDEVAVKYKGVRVEVAPNQDVDNIKKIVSNLINLPVEDIEIYE